MRVVANVSKTTIKLILKIIYKITKLYCIFYSNNFPEEENDWDDLLDRWIDKNR